MSRPNSETGTSNTNRQGLNPGEDKVRHLHRPNLLVLQHTWLFDQRSMLWRDNEWDKQRKR